MKRSSSSLAALIAVALLLALVVAPRAEAVTCAVTELLPCLPALTGKPKPTPACCTKLKEQKPCLCGYLKDPALRKYWSNPNAKKVADACKVPIPSRC